MSPSEEVIDAGHAGVDIVKIHEGRLTSQLIAGLQGLSKTIKIVGISDPRAYSRRVSTVSFTIPGHHPDEIARYFGNNGLQIWSGDHYGAEPTRVVGLSERGGGVRVGPVHYNTAEEIDRVIETLDRYLKAH